MIKAVDSLSRRTILKLIKCYQLFLSPLFPPACRFHPTCSEYAEESLTDIPLDRSLCLVMGSEGEGLKRKLLEACDYKVAIETPGKLSTLNVSVATGILLHAMRQSALE